MSEKETTVDATDVGGSARGSGDSRIDTCDLVRDGLNSHLLRCFRCRSKILPQGKGTYMELDEPFSLVTFRQKDGETGESEEKLSQFYRVEDMFDFDNVSFTKTVGSVQFLACADCEIGPVGYFDRNKKKSFVALARVEHYLPSR